METPNHNKGPLSKPIPHRLVRSHLLQRMKQRLLHGTVHKADGLHPALHLSHRVKMSNVIEGMTVFLFLVLLPQGALAVDQSEKQGTAGPEHTIHLGDAVSHVDAALTDPAP